MMASLAEDGFPAVEIRQGWVTMAPAVKELERAIIGGKFRHGGHPVLRWNFANIAVETDKAGNGPSTRARAATGSTAPLAAAMAVGRAHDGGRVTEGGFLVFL